MIIVEMLKNTAGDLSGFLPMQHNEAKFQYSHDFDESCPQIPKMRRYIK